MTRLYLCPYGLCGLRDLLPRVEFGCHEKLRRERNTPWIDTNIHGVLTVILICTRCISASTLCGEINRVFLLYVIAMFTVVLLIVCRHTIVMKATCSPHYALVTNVTDRASYWQNKNISSRLDSRTLRSVNVYWASKGSFIATQLNSTRRRVELCRYKRAFSL